MNNKSEIEKTKIYWYKVFSKAWKLAFEKSGIKGFTIAIFLALIIFGGLLILSQLGLLPEKFLELVGDFKSEIRTQAVYWFFGIFITCIIFIFSFIYIPAKIYEEQGGFIENPFELSYRHPLLKKANEFRWASITVKNITRAIINDCFVTLDDIVDKKGESILFSRQRRLSWSSGEGLDGHPVNKELNIIPNEPRVIDVATTSPNNKKALFTVWRGSQEVSIGTYQLIITAHGLWNGKVVEKTNHFILIYKGKNKLSIENVDD